MTSSQSVRSPLRTCCNCVIKISFKISHNLNLGFSKSLLIYYHKSGFYFSIVVIYSDDITHVDSIINIFTFMIIIYHPLILCADFMKQLLAIFLDYNGY